MSRTYSAKQFKFIVLKKKKKPYIFVEGKDDIAFYENIVESIDRNYVVKPIGRYKDTSNCTAVIQWMQELDVLLKEEEDRKYFLGIIDGDARKYRNNLPNGNNLLYILEYYSWESYFINREVVSKSIKNFLKSRTLLTDNSIEYIYTQFIENHLLDELWLCGLKRLRDYASDTVCNQDASINRLDKDKEFIKNLKNLEKELFDFAIQEKIIKNNQTLLEITKGKWALDFFVKKYLQILKELPALCRDVNIEIIESCDYCKNKDFDNCLYELRANYREEHIRADITNLMNLTSLTPIKERLKQLK